MTLLETCYIDEEDGQYHMLRTHDLRCVCENYKFLYDGLAIVSATGVEILRPGVSSIQNMDDIRFGCLYLRENPRILPILILGEYDRKMASLEIVREVDDTSTVCREVEGNLVMALIKCKEPTVHVGFW